MQPVRIHAIPPAPRGRWSTRISSRPERGSSTLTARSPSPKSRALRAQVESLQKPLLAVLVTHAHPDHHGGVVELVGGDDLPAIAAAGVDAVIRRDDALKEQILRPMFGDEWPQQRMFPNRAVSDGETLEFGGASFTVIDLGPSESPHDSIWLHGCRAPWHSPAPAPSSTVA